MLNVNSIDNQFLLNGFDDFTLKQDLNSTKYITLLPRYLNQI